LELGTGASGQKTRMMELPGRERSFTTSSTIWIQCTNVTDGLADGQTDTRRQQRPLLRIASCSEMQRKRRRRRRVHPTVVVVILRPRRIIKISTAALARQESTHQRTARHVPDAATADITVCQNLGCPPTLRIC